MSDMISSYEKQRHWILGVTGGIAAYKTAELVRLLTKRGDTVQVVMTEAATEFMTPTTLQALSGNPVFVSGWDLRIPNAMPHIHLSRQADAILIAPASADFIAKLAHGFANDLLSTLCLARECPLFLAPAMNRQMWENPATCRNIEQIQQNDILLLDPDSGEQACGEVGTGRMLEPERIVKQLDSYFTPKLLSGKKIMITAGATIEMIDPVRGITNISSGKMGFALARVATQMGADVTLIYGNAQIETPEVHLAIHAKSAAAMYQAVMQHIVDQNIFMSVAAVADFSPDSTSEQKIKKSKETLTLSLKKNIDILSAVARLPHPPYCVGFAAETEHILENARDKRLRKQLPMMIANNANQVMGSDDTEVVIIDSTGELALPRANKQIVARLIMEHLATHIP